jgi:hypothetical protein
MKTKRILRWTWLLTGVVAVYTAVVMGLRWQGNREWETETRQREADADRKIVERYGSGQLKVLMFYANPPSMRAGGKTLLCYGVSNAKSVVIEPAVKDVSPSISRCVETNPRVDTQYQLVATGERRASRCRLP